MKIAGIDKERLREFYDLEVSEEDWQEFTSRKNGALLGIDIADDRSLGQRYIWEEGQEFAMADFGGLTLYMAGVFTPRDPTLRSVILVGDVFLMEADDRLGTANQILTKIRNREEADRAAAQIDALDFPVELETRTQSAALEAAVADLDEMLRYASHVILIVAVIIFVGLANATSMAVRERVREVGMLRSLGFSRLRVALMVAGETFLLTAVGGLLGCAGALVAVKMGGITMHVGSYSFPVVVSLPLAAVAVVASAVVGILGGLPAGARISRRPIVDAIRSVD